MKTIVGAWPDPPAKPPEGYLDSHEVQDVAVNNVLKRLLGYPHGVTDAWNDSFGMPQRAPSRSMVRDTVGHRLGRYRCLQLAPIPLS